jgi:hypothetical protein
MARFLMNLMMASGGYPWTIVRTARSTDGGSGSTNEHGIHSAKDVPDG